MIKIDMWYGDKKNRQQDLISGLMISVAFIPEILQFSGKQLAIITPTACKKFVKHFRI